MKIPSNLFTERTEAVLKPKVRCDLKAATTFIRQTNRTKNMVELIVMKKRQRPPLKLQLVI